MSRPGTAGFKSSGFRTWTEDEENRVRVGIAEGKSIAELATKCNRTEKAVRMRLNLFAEKDISKGAAPDVVLAKYKIPTEDFAMHNKEKKNTMCKVADCGNPSSPKSTLGYCATHLNVDRVGKKDMDAITESLKRIEEMQKNMTGRLNEMEVLVKSIAEKVLK